MQELFKKIADIIDVFISFLFAILFLIVIGNTLFRYFFNTSLMWSIDLSLFLYIIIIFFGTASAIISKDYMRVKVIVDRVPKNTFKFLELIAYILILIFGVAVLIGAVKMFPQTWDSRTSGILLWLRTAYLYAVMVFAFFIVSIASILQIGSRIIFWNVKDKI